MNIVSPARFSAQSLHNKLRSLNPEQMNFFNVLSPARFFYNNSELSSNSNSNGGGSTNPTEVKPSYSETLTQISMYFDGPENLNPAASTEDWSDNESQHSKTSDITIDEAIASSIPSTPITADPQESIWGAIFSQSPQTKKVKFADQPVDQVQKINYNAMVVNEDDNSFAFHNSNKIVAPPSLQISPDDFIDFSDSAVHTPVFSLSPQYFGIENFLDDDGSVTASDSSSVYSNTAIHAYTTTDDNDNEAKSVASSLPSPQVSEIDTEKREEEAEEEAESLLPQGEQLNREQHSRELQQGETIGRAQVAEIASRTASQYSWQLKWARHKQNRFNMKTSHKPAQQHRQWRQRRKQTRHLSQHREPRVSSSSDDDCEEQPEQLEEELSGVTEQCWADMTASIDEADHYHFLLDLDTDEDQGEQSSWARDADTYSPLAELTSASLDSSSGPPTLDTFLAESERLSKEQLLVRLYLAESSVETLTAQLRAGQLREEAQAGQRSADTHNLLTSLRATAQVLDTQLKIVLPRPP